MCLSVTSILEPESLVLEIEGLQQALESGVCGNACGGHPITFREEFLKQKGVYTRPYCFVRLALIPFSFTGESKNKVVTKLVFTNKCGGTRASLNMLFGLQSASCCNA